MCKSRTFRCTISERSKRNWNQRIFIIIDRITRMIEMVDKNNGSLLFFSLLVFCAT